MERKDSLKAIQTDLQINEHFRWQVTGWKAQTVGLISIFMIVIAASLGFFGDGVLSRQTIDASSVRFDYHRFLRFESNTSLKINTVADQGEFIDITIPSSYLDYFLIDGIVPEPAHNSIAQNKVSYSFKANGPLIVTFYLRPKSIGRVKGHVTINQQEMKIDHFIFP